MKENGGEMRGSSVEKSCEFPSSSIYFSCLKVVKVP